MRIKIPFLVPVLGARAEGLKITIYQRLLKTALWAKNRKTLSKKANQSAILDNTCSTKLDTDRDRLGNYQKKS